MERTTCCIVGGGPAGMVLGLLLARAGVHVTVLEKHGDFLRDFRGDTVHPTTLSLMDQLGLGERFAELPQRRIDTIQFPLAPDGELFTVGDISSLSTKYNYIAMVPQWDLLDLLADAGKQEPTFTLRMNTEVTEPIVENGRVNGVHYRTSDGETGRLRASITVACDGRGSFARELSELGLRDYPCPMDAWWFKLPRHDGDPSGLVGNPSDGLFSIMFDRGDYWQCAAIIPKGADAALRAEGLDAFLDKFTESSAPWMRARGPALTSWDDVKLLDVRLDRLRRWDRPGLLCIGDAAHAMSPVGGIGINLAVQDAVATARHLAEPLRDGRLRRRHVRRVQRRRMPTTALVQGFQRLVHDRVVRPILRGDLDSANRPKPLLLAYRAISRMPWLRKVPAYLVAYGAMREHPPKAALR